MFPSHVPLKSDGPNNNQGYVYVLTYVPPRPTEVELLYFCRPGVPAEEGNCYNFNNDLAARLRITRHNLKDQTKTRKYSYIIMR